MRFFVLLILFVGFVGVCLTSTSDATSRGSANVMTLSLAADTGDTEVDAADEKTSFGFFRRTRRALRHMRPFRGRCRSCG